MLFIFFLLSIEWQNITRPKNDSLVEFIIYFKIPQHDLKFTTRDSFFFAGYEAQLKVYDQRGNQLTGDYWQRERFLDSLEIEDSIKLNIPLSARKFDLKIIDLQADEIFNITDKILPISFLGNIRWFIASDTLYVNYTIFNTKGEIDSISVSIKQMKKNIVAKKESYNDFLSFWVLNLPNDIYNLKFEAIGRSKKIEEVSIPIKITRPFYLDDATWFLRVSQLEYIAVEEDLRKLRSSQKENRDSLWHNFWKQYDPTPNTHYNEKEEEYFSRINYCQEHFSFGDKGWRSDRARIYVKYGPPDEIQSRPYEYYSKPFEIWLYYKLNLKFIFYDRYGFGEYILINSGGSRI